MELEDEELDAELLDVELLYSERKKIQWILEEFEIQFPKHKENSIKDPKKSKYAQDLMTFLANNVNTLDFDLLEYMINSIDVILKKYEDFFK
jgi:hypothetical protein